MGFGSAAGGSGAPPRPAAWEERCSSRLFRFLSPRLERVPGLPPAPELAPWEYVPVPRDEGGGILTGTWYPATAPARGGVLLLPPWVRVGQAYFHRGSRLPSLRAAGYHVLTLDFSGLPGGPPPAGFLDRDAAAGLRALRQRLDAALPLHVWGVSSGGYWVQLALSRMRLAAGAVFEDVPPHLVEWSWKAEPRGRPGYLTLRHVLPRAYRFLDLRRHAAHLGAAAVAYVSGEQDPGVLAADTADLARRAGGRCLVVPAAYHLGAYRLAGARILALALATFAAAEGSRSGAAEAAPAADIANIHPAL